MQPSENAQSALRQRLPYFLTIAFVARRVCLGGWRLASPPVLWWC